MRVSASMLKTWMDCPLQAKFKYQDHLPDRTNAKTAFGRCVHYALEVYNNTSAVELAVTTFRDVWKNPEKIEAAFDYWPRYSTFGGLMQRGTEICREYHDKQRWEKRRVIASEHRFLVPFGDHTLSGIVDLVESKKSSKGVETLRIVDYKTSSYKPTSPQLRVNVQFTGYVYASMQREFWLGNGPEYPPMPNGEFYWETIQDLPRRAIWYHLWTNQEIDAGDRDQKDFNRMYRVAVEIQRALDAQVFVPNISGSSCTICPYTEPCGIQIPTKEEMHDEGTSF